MAEPVSLGVMLLGIVVQEFARAGFSSMFERFESRPVTPAGPAALAKRQTVSVIDLVSGAPATARASVHISAATPLKPYWVLFGVHPADGPPRVTPVLYGEPVELKVIRGQYGLSALFLTKPTSFAEKPLLTAVGYAHEVLASGAGPQSVALLGSVPTKEQLDHLRAQVPAGQLPFRVSSLPHAGGVGPAQQLGAWPLRRPVPPLTNPRFVTPALPPPRPQPAQPVRPASGSPHWASPWARVVPPATQQPAKPALPAPRPQPVRPVRPLTWVPATCQARNRQGKRCGQPIGLMGQGRLCSTHVKEVLLGDYIVWHESGQRIRWNLGGWY
jgi:hypothetical protein